MVTPKKHIITIAGRPGSGKSTTAKLVAQQLEYQHFSSGDLFRQIGKELGIDLLTANRTAEEKAEIDERVDGRLREIGKTEDKQVIDSRMAWHWMPQSFKVYLDLDLDTAARRVIGGMDEARLHNEHVPTDPHEYAKILGHRLESEALRYKTKYDANPFDTSNYDLVIDTAANDVAQVVELVLTGFRDWMEA